MSAMENFTMPVNTSTTAPPWHSTLTVWHIGAIAFGGTVGLITLLLICCAIVYCKKHCSGRQKPFHKRLVDLYHSHQFRRIRQGCDIDEYDKINIYVSSITNMDKIKEEHGDNETTSHARKATARASLLHSDWKGMKEFSDFTDQLGHRRTIVIVDTFGLSCLLNKWVAYKWAVMCRKEQKRACCCRFASRCRKRGCGCCRSDYLMEGQKKEIRCVVALKYRNDNIYDEINRKTNLKLRANERETQIKRLLQIYEGMSEILILLDDFNIDDNPLHPSINELINGNGNFRHPHVVLTVSYENYIKNEQRFKEMIGLETQVLYVRPEHYKSKYTGHIYDIEPRHSVCITGKLLDDRESNDAIISETMVRNIGRCIDSPGELVDVTCEGDSRDTIIGGGKKVSGLVVKQIDFKFECIGNSEFERFKKYYIERKLQKDINRTMTAELFKQLGLGKKQNLTLEFHDH